MSLARLKASKRLNVRPARLRDLLQVSRTETGSVLLIAVIVLLLLALSGLYSANLSSIESRIAANTKSELRHSMRHRQGLKRRACDCRP